LNLAEGALRSGRDRLHLFRVAGASAAEVRACLDVAEAFGYLESVDVSDPRGLVERILAMTWRLTH
jgi:four helix bundle protein